MKTVKKEDEVEGEITKQSKGKGKTITKMDIKAEGDQEMEVESSEKTGGFSAVIGKKGKAKQSDTKNVDSNHVGGNKVEKTVERSGDLRRSKRTKR